MATDFPLILPHPDSDLIPVDPAERAAFYARHGHGPLPTEPTEIPASRLMRERSHFRAESERLQAEVLRLVGENERLRIQRDDARQLHASASAALSLANRQTLYHQIATDRVRLELHEARRSQPVDRKELEALRERVAKLEADRKKDAGTIGDLREMLEETLKSDAVGTDCEACGGYGGHGDDRDNWDECDAECFAGRVPR